MLAFVLLAVFVFSGLLFCYLGLRGLRQQQQTQAVPLLERCFVTPLPTASPSLLLAVLQLAIFCGQPSASYTPLLAVPFALA